MVPVTRPVDFLTALSAKLKDVERCAVEEVARLEALNAQLCDRLAELGAPLWPGDVLCEVSAEIATEHTFVKPKLTTPVVEVRLPAGFGQSASKPSLSAVRRSAFAESGDSESHTASLGHAQPNEIGVEIEEAVTSLHEMLRVESPPMSPPEQETGLPSGAWNISLPPVQAQQSAGDVAVDSESSEGSRAREPPAAASTASSGLTSIGRQQSPASIGSTASMGRAMNARRRPSPGRLYFSEVSNDGEVQAAGKLQAKSVTWSDDAKQTPRGTGAYTPRQSSPSRHKDSTTTMSPVYSINATFKVHHTWNRDTWKTDVQAGKSTNRDLPRFPGIDNQKFNDHVAKMSSLRELDDTTAVLPCCPRCAAMSPMAPLAISADFLFALLVLYDFVTVPMLFFGLPEEGFFLTMLWIVRISWSLAIPRSFCTGFVTSDGAIEVRPTLVINHYVKTWLAFDVLVVALDWSELFFANLDAVSSLRVLKTARVLRLIRVLRMLQIVQVPGGIVAFVTRHYTERVHLAVCIFKSACWFLGVVHYIACLWYGIGTLREGSSQGSWITESIPSSETLSTRYWFSAHWAITQFIGSSFVTPHTNSETAFAVATLSFTFVACAAFVSNFTAFMTQLQILGENRAKQFSVLQLYLRRVQLSPELTTRVMKCARFVVDQKEKDIREEDVHLFETVSESLKMEIHYEVYCPLLTQHPFFCRYHLLNPMAVRKICHTAVEDMTLITGDLVFTEGEEPQKPQMFFVKSGTLLYMRVVTPVISEVGEGTWVCEKVLWTRWVHVGSLRAATNSRLIALDANTFREVASEHKQTNYPAGYAREFTKLLNDALRSGEVVDDLQDAIDIKEIVSRTSPHPLANGRTRVASSGFDLAEGLKRNVDEIVKTIPLLNRAWTKKLTKPQSFFRFRQTERKTTDDHSPRESATATHATARQRPHESIHEDEEEAANKSTWSRPTESPITPSLCS